MSLDPKRAAVSNWQKQQSRRGERSVEAVKDRRDQGRGSDGMMLRILRIAVEREKTGGLLFAEGRERFDVNP